MVAAANKAAPADWTVPLAMAAVPHHWHAAALIVAAALIAAAASAGEVHLKMCWPVAAA